MSEQVGTLNADDRQITTYERFPVFSEDDNARVQCMKCIIDEIVPEAISDFLENHAKIPTLQDSDQSITYQVSCDGSRKAALGHCAMKITQFKDHHSNQAICEVVFDNQGLRQL